MDIPRQVGLTARYGIEGLGQAAGVVTEPIRQGLNVGLRAIDYLRPHRPDRYCLLLPMQSGFRSHRTKTSVPSVT